MKYRKATTRKPWFWFGAGTCACLAEFPLQINMIEPTSTLDICVWGDRRFCGSHVFQRSMFSLPEFLDLSCCCFFLGKQF